MITALAGGIGAAKFLKGLQPLIGKNLTVIGNTGDDLEIHGLRVCPDLDTVLYTLTGRVNATTGWGVDGDTFHCLDVLRELGAPTWFQLGDRDLALHLVRSQKLRQGWRLTAVTEELASRLGLSCRLLPMCEGYHPTRVETESGLLHLQEYFVRERCEPKVRGFVYGQLQRAGVEREVRAALSQSRAVLLCPSNPFISLMPILRVPELKELITAVRRRVAVTPIIGGEAVKGPAAKMLRELGRPVSALGVAECYEGLVTDFVLDQRDAELAPQIESLGMQVHIVDTMMIDEPASQRLAAQVLELI